MKRYKVFILILIIGSIFIVLIPDYINMNEDTAQYIEIANDFSDTSIRPIGYPALIRLAMLAKDWYTIIIIIQLLMFAGIMQAVYAIRKQKYVIVALLLSGAYICYIPFVLSDLAFSFFVVLSYLSLIRKKLAWHIILIGIASLIRPTVAYFFVIEPFLVWFIFRDKKLAMLSFFLCFIATSFSPIKNLIDNGHFQHTTILDMQMDKYWGGAENKLFYPFYSVFSNSCSAHWDNLFKIFGMYKRDISGMTSLNANAFAIVIHYLFIAVYLILYPIYIFRSLKNRDWVSLLWVAYFTATCVSCHTIGGRHRLSFEFLIW